MKQVKLVYLGIDAPDYFRGWSGNLIQVPVDRHSTFAYLKSEMINQLHDFYHENGEEFTNEEYLCVENQIRELYLSAPPSAQFAPFLDYTFDDVGGCEHFMNAYFGVEVS